MRIDSLTLPPERRAGNKIPVNSSEVLNEGHSLGVAPFKRQVAGLKWPNQAQLSPRQSVSAQALRPPEGPPQHQVQPPGLVALVFAWLWKEGSAG